MGKQRILIMGAAGRDFHNFNTFFRNNDDYEVVAFTAAQIPDIDGRVYPAELAGDMYPNGIPIEPEDKLERLIKTKSVEKVIFAYSDVPHEYVMNKGAMVNAFGADFTMMGTKTTMLKSKGPVVAVCAVRTGCGKSQTTRKVSEILKNKGKKIVVIRHPMPYGNLVAQRVQRFETIDDLHKNNCTIEEMEEYEPHIMNGSVVYAGVDYGDILQQAEQEADVILWDGGNNDLPFIKPDLHIVVTDPLRPGDELTYYPGETNLRLADVVVINKVVEADFSDVQLVRSNIRDTNPLAIIIEAGSPLFVENDKVIANKRVLVVEDGPTLTHGQMDYGAGVVAAEKFGAAEIVDPRPYLVGSLKETFDRYPDIGTLLPAMGYGEEQIRDLAATINATDCDSVVVATPIDLSRVITINKPTARVRYELQEIGKPNLEDVLKDF